VTAARRRSVVVATGVVLALVLVESLLRGLDYPTEHPVGWAWHGDPAEANEFGLRGHRTGGRGDDAVILLGDSQVESLQSFASMPEVFLAEALRRVTDRDVRVVSVAAFGWGQDQQLLALRRALPSVKPRMVLLWFTPNNDLWNNTFPTHMPRNGRPKPTFWLEGGTLRGPHASWGTAYRPSGPRLLRAIRPILRQPMYVSDEDWEAKLPPPYHARPAVAGAVSLVEYATSRLGFTRPEVELVLAPENFDNEKTHVSIALTPRSPRLDYSIRLTRALLREIAELCARHGARFVVFHVDTGPTGAPEEPTPFEIAGRIVTLSNAAARTVVRDTLAEVPSLVLRGDRPEFHVSRTDHHFNEVGNRYFMTELAERVAVRRLLKHVQIRAGEEWRD
jgi:hypothetical protein